MPTKPTRTMSGVTPIAVVLEPRPCPHGTCVYCPTLGVPQSYTPLSPAIMRAKELNYDPYKQVLARIKSFEAMGHPTEKIELIIMGGTFTAYPIDYQYWFIKRCFDAMNGREAKDLEEAKKINETAKHRCVALCIETRPDYCREEDVKRMLELGATRCELGVQLPDDEIYRITKRGHTVKDVADATKRLKDAGFKVGYHLMPGLPGSSIKNDLEKFGMIFKDERFMPDQIKIYPTQVMKGSELELWHKEKKYTTYSDRELISLLKEIKLLVPGWVRIMRVMREIPPSFILNGTKKIDMRNIIYEELKKEGKSCRCIRCREIGFSIVKGTISREEASRLSAKDLNLTVQNYRASGGDEYFISYEYRGLLFGLCRLRIMDGNSDYAFVRELHVYGPELKIKDATDSTSTKKAIPIQHSGLGKKLMQKAEEIARERKIRKLYVISGVGVREYYRKLGYEFEDPYMAKELQIS
ncbi:MAG: tRNA uridine(34) 5-carboxymethylaminomethyl modification radical SAM/GNAT enzyme Elp3 [Candidatus Micrarchaeota archaeon]|nr:tRNA uridine(34) 5-carboxymethylaminomethyl modification radical SAM/GNAT enzyme Elp3 [Candidatus Micrarchaeota archaeon]